MDRNSCLKVGGSLYYAFCFPGIQTCDSAKLSAMLLLVDRGSGFDCVEIHKPESVSRTWKFVMFSDRMQFCGIPV